MRPGRKVGDYTKTYSNPFKKKVLIGIVKLIRLIEDYGELELWEVKYIDFPSHSNKQILIKKP